MTKTVVEILKEARELISDKSRWCQGSFALDEIGTSVWEASPRACRWCARGAIVKVVYDHSDRYPDEARTAEVLLNQCSKAEVGIGLVSLNDQGAPHVAHPRVMKAFDCAIKKAESQQ